MGKIFAVQMRSLYILGSVTSTDPRSLRSEPKGFYDNVLIMRLTDLSHQVKLIIVAYITSALINNV